MTGQVSEFQKQVSHQILSEKKIVGSFEVDSERNIIAALTNVLRDSTSRYNKIVEMLEAASLGSDEIFPKWQTIQKRLNEEAFGIVDWSILLEELKEARTNQEQLLSDTTGERARLRGEIPTSFVRSPDPYIEPSPFPIVTAEEIKADDDVAEKIPLELTELVPTAPESKE